MNKLVDEYNNSCHCSIGKNAIDTNCSVLTEEIETHLKAPKFKVGERVMIIKYKNIISKGYTNNWSRGILVIDSVLKTNSWTYKTKYLNGETIIGSFYEKDLLLKKIVNELLSRTR